MLRRKSLGSAATRFQSWLRLWLSLDTAVVSLEEKMSLNCKASDSDKDQWEKLGGFFLFPGYIEQCAIVRDYDTVQADVRNPYYL